jgi:TonB-linked SusC/RagA family outer membrane protein
MKRFNVWAIPFVILALATMASPSQALAQTGNVTGRILDASTQAPLESAQVSIVGQGTGGLTNTDGRFIISGVPVGTVTVRAQLLGYVTQNQQVTVSSGGAVAADFQLEVGALELEGVVVTALGISREERGIGYSVQGVDGAELLETRSTNIINNLAGKVAGLTVIPAAVLGGSTKMVLRGVSSISGNNEPLIVVDGIPMDNSRRETATAGGTRGATVRNRSGIDYGNMAQDIDPSNIESVTVLRGANAAALYGSRASNGVVEITTKTGRGTAGTVVSASTNVVFETPLRLVRYQNAFGGGATDGDYNWVDGRGAGVNDGVDESWGPALNAGHSFPQWWSDGISQPWLASPMNVREYFQTGHNVTTNVAIAHSSERANIRFSALRMDATGMPPEQGANRTQLAINAGVEVTPKLTIDGSVQYTESAGHNRPGIGNGSYSAIHIFNWFQRQADGKRMERANDLWDPNGGVLTPNFNHNYHDNVYWLQHHRNNDDSRNRITGQVTGNYQLNDWVTARVRLGTDWFEQLTKEVYPFYSQDTPEGGFVESSAFRQETNLEALITANRQLSSDFSLNVNGGANMRRNEFDLKEAGSRKLNVPEIYNVSNSASPPLLNNMVQYKEVNSLYGLVTLGFREFAFLDVTARNDWSSTLPEDNRSYFYPSFSGSLVFTDAFDMASDFLSFGKIRGSWAKVGNDANPYQLTSVYSETDKFGNIPGFTTSNTIPNAGLRPEETVSWEIGTDLRFWFDRASLDLTYYNSVTKDQILAVDVSESSGYTRQVLNAGEVQNKGIEALLTLDILREQQNGIAWDITLNFGKNDSEVLALAQSLEAIRIGRGGGIRGGVEARPGHPYGVFYGPTWQRDGKGNILVGDNGLPLRGDSKIIGDYQPDWTGGLRSSVTYGAFTFSAQVDTRKGGQIFCGSCRLGYRTGVLYESANATKTDWDPDGRQGRGMTVFPGVTASGATNSVAVDARKLATRLDDVDTEWLFDNNFTKLREVAIGFDLPQQYLNKLPVSTARFTIVGRNIWLWTKVPHIDPDGAYIDGSPSEANLAGIEYEQFPTARTFGFNVAVTH